MFNAGRADPGGRGKIMPDPHRLQNELLAFLSRPQYSSIFYHRNQFCGPRDPISTPQLVAAQTAQHVSMANGLLDPVEVVELRGRLEFYRAYDGGIRRDSARTLGRYWFERRTVEEIWGVTARHPGADRQATFMEFLRTANFVLPEWNDMTQIAVMVIPAGATVVVIKGKGNWKAMRTPPGRPRPGGASPIFTQNDVIHQGMMPIPGTVQCVVPLFNDNWITQVPRLSQKWPLYT